MSKIYGIGDEELAEDLQKELPNRIIEELEKIKAEILSECPNTNARMICISILYKHISKLKGVKK